MERGISVNYLMKIFEEERNNRLGRNSCLAVDSLLFSCSNSTISKSIKQCNGKDDTETILIPTHFQHASHWGLAKIEVKTKSIFFL